VTDLRNVSVICSRTRIEFSTQACGQFTALNNGCCWFSVSPTQTQTQVCATHNPQTVKATKKKTRMPKRKNICVPSKRRSLPRAAALAVALVFVFITWLAVGLLGFSLFSMKCSLITSVQIYSTHKSHLAVEFTLIPWGQIIQWLWFIPIQNKLNTHFLSACCCSLVCCVVYRRVFRHVLKRINKVTCLTFVVKGVIVVFLFFANHSYTKQNMQHDAAESLHSLPTDVFNINISNY